jgi:hypothetical protein
MIAMIRPAVQRVVGAAALGGAVDTIAAIVTPFRPSLQYLQPRRWA